MKFDDDYIFDWFIKVDENKKDNSFSVVFDIYLGRWSFENLNQWEVVLKFWNTENPC